MQFSGTITAHTDAKGRVFLPSAFRKLIDDPAAEFVLKRDVYQPCLVVYHEAAWSAELSSLQSRLDHWIPQHAMLLRQFMSDVERFTLDANGRFLIPKRLLEAAGIGRDVAFVGVGDRIEIWDKARAEAEVINVDPAALAQNLQEVMASSAVNPLPHH